MNEFTKELNKLVRQKVLADAEAEGRSLTMQELDYESTLVMMQLAEKIFGTFVGK